MKDEIEMSINWTPRQSEYLEKLSAIEKPYVLMVHPLDVPGYEILNDGKDWLLDSTKSPFGRATVVSPKVRRGPPMKCEVTDFRPQPDPDRDACQLSTLKATVTVKPSGVE